MSLGQPPDERRRGDDPVLNAINDLSARLEDTRRSLNRQIEGVRQRQEKQVAVALALQDHKTIERVDVIWETLDDWRKLAETAKAVGARLARFTAWGCGTFLALGALIVAAQAAGIIHLKW